eukprot:gene27149-48672_t
MTRLLSAGRTRVRPDGVLLLAVSRPGSSRRHIREHSRHRARKRYQRSRPVPQAVSTRSWTIVAGDGGIPLSRPACGGRRVAIGREGGPGQVGPSLSGVPTLELLSAEALRSTVVTFRDHLKVHQAGINRLNVYPVPDGDTGTNMARTLDAVVAELVQADAGIAPTCV